MNPWLLVGIVGIFALGLVLAFVFVKIPDARRTFDRIVDEECEPTRQAERED